MVDFGLIQGLRGKSAVRACNDIFAPDQICEANNSLGDKLRMLDDVASVGNDARTNYFALGKLICFKDVILVFMPAFIFSTNSITSMSAASYNLGPSLMP